VTRPLVLAALLLASAGPASGAGPRGEESSSAEGVARHAMNLLADERVEEAEAVLAPLFSSSPAQPAAALAEGVLRFHEQRYAEAVELLQGAAGSEAGRDWLELARNARDVTRDHLRAESEHFAVSYPKGKEEVLSPYLLEALESQRAALEKDFGWVPPGKVVVEILENTRELARLSTLTEEEIKTTGTIAICKFNKLMVTSPKALVHGYEWLDTAAHEYVHHVITLRTHNATPIWLHEGLARWHESRWRGPGGEILSPWSAALLRDAAKRNRLVTFAQMHPSMAKLPSQEAAALAFAEVAVAVDYMKKRGGPAAMARLLDGLASGASAEDAVARATGEPFGAFLDGWRRSLVTRPLPEGGDQEMRTLRFQGDPKHGGAYSEWAGIPDEAARRFARLGEIFRERGRFEAARQEYAKAVKRVGAKNPALAGRYAMASLATGHEAEAERALSEALRGHPEDAALHVDKGRLYLRRQEWRKAAEEFLLANRVDPFDPEIHAGLGQAFRTLGDDKTASREEQFARILYGHEAAAGGGPSGPSPAGRPRD